MINREDLVKLIADSDVDWKCQSFTPYACKDDPMLCHACATQVMDMYDNKVREDAIDEFVRCCKATETHLITNWEKPFGIDFEGIDVISEQLKEKNNG